MLVGSIPHEINCRTLTTKKLPLLFFSYRSSAPAMASRRRSPASTIPSRHVLPSSSAPTPRGPSPASKAEHYTAAPCIQLSHLDSDDDMDPGDGILAMQLPQGFRLQERHPTVLDRTLIKRYVVLRRGLGWFLGQISRTAAPQTSNIYDYRVVLASDQSTISAKLPLAAYSVDEENAAVGAWALLEPIEGGSNGLEDECEGDQGRRTSSRARTPNVRNIDQLG